MRKPDCDTTLAGLLVLALVWCAGCGAASPAAPTPVPVPPAALICTTVPGPRQTYQLVCPPTQAPSVAPR